MNIFSESMYIPSSISLTAARKYVPPHLRSVVDQLRRKVHLSNDVWLIIWRFVFNTSYTPDRWNNDYFEWFKWWYRTESQYTSNPMVVFPDPLESLSNLTSTVYKYPIQTFGLYRIGCRRVSDDSTSIYSIIGFKGDVFCGVVIPSEVTPQDDYGITKIQYRFMDGCGLPTVNVESCFNKSIPVSSHTQNELGGNLYFDAHRGLPEKFQNDARSLYAFMDNDLRCKLHVDFSQYIYQIDIPNGRLVPFKSSLEK